jgi:hypothetical protein
MVSYRDDFCYSTDSWFMTGSLQGREFSTCVFVTTGFLSSMSVEETIFNALK